MTNLAFPPIPVSFDDDERLGAQITLLAGQINAATHRLLKLIAEFDQRKAWSGGGTVRSCAHWLNWKCGIALVAAREKVRVANALLALPLIDAAFATGEISYSKVRAMTRVATARNEDYLLHIARYGTASHVEGVVRRYRKVQQQNVEAVEHRQDNERQLVYYQDDDGMWIIHAKLPPEAGALVVKAIEAVAAPEQERRQTAQREEAVKKNDDENDSAGSFSDAVEAEAPAGFRELLSHTRADALVTITEHFLATCGTHARWRGLKGSERCQVVLHVDINTLRQSGKEPGPQHEHCHLDEKPWVSPTTARRLCCDASLVTVLHDNNGKVLNVGRRSRSVPAPIGRALRERDRTCRFPGCCEARYTDVHHIHHWADGGETSLDNLVTLCRYHHRQLHAGSYSIAVQKRGLAAHLVFTTPSGRRIEESVFPQFPRDSAESSRCALQAVAPSVTTTTCITQWHGESCDHGMAIDALLWRDSLKSERTIEAYPVENVRPKEEKNDRKRAMTPLPRRLT
ncbi:MAG: DUF222 domain-containing protein [Halioglobus sp.]|nr:DUF222 domain-containing protein [Halioglobus sp.]